ncbi:MAG: hypothetical protein IKV69_00120 [Clostridia bacterium]|nr:hypothetical protein [Clostridia bacterium]
MKERFENFTNLISGISRSIRKIKTEEMQEFNLKSQHVSCIYYIHKNVALTPKELCEICQEDKAMVSRSLEVLDKKGFLMGESTDKKYRKLISLSEKGKQIARKVAEKIDKVLSLASAELSQEKRLAMYEGLALVNSNLNKICKNYGEKNGN